MHQRPHVKELEDHYTIKAQITNAKNIGVAHTDKNIKFNMRVMQMNFKIYIKKENFY